MENFLDGTDNLRAKYMDGRLTHTEYYTEIAKLIGATKRLLPVNQKEINNSTDNNLNDIPLARWDSMHEVIRSMAARAGMTCWSQAETVSLLKTIAKW